MRTMEEVLAAHPAPKTAAEYKAAIAALLAEMEHLNDLMAKDRMEIERLKAETAVIRAETDIIKAQAQARLEALRARNGIENT